MWKKFRELQTDFRNVYYTALKEMDESLDKQSLLKGKSRKKENWSRNYFLPSKKYRVILTQHTILPKLNEWQYLSSTNYYVKCKIEKERTFPVVFFNEVGITLTKAQQQKIVGQYFWGAQTQKFSVKYLQTECKNTAKTLSTINLTLPKKMSGLVQHR